MECRVENQHLEVQGDPMEGPPSGCLARRQGYAGPHRGAAALSTHQKTQGHPDLLKNQLHPEMEEALE
jgi:hypothetical protein